MKAMKAALAVLLLTATVHAEDKMFWGLAAGAEASTIYDMETTLRVLSRCPACAEANPVMRPFVQQPAGAYGMAFGLTTASALAAHELKQRGARWWWAPLAGQIAMHTVFAIRNSRIR